MSQPTQQLPPWLKPSVVVVTDAAGAPVATNTEIVYVPPTYFGPSIPLGSLYIFGGTTEPATIAFSAAPSTVANSATTPAIPPTTTPLTTSATPTTTVPTTTTAITSSATPTTAPITIITSNSNSASFSFSSSTFSVSAASAASSISPILSSTITSGSPTTTQSSGLTTTPTTPTTTVSGALPPTHTFTAPPTVSATVQKFGGLTKGQLVGVIVASILGLIFLFVLALFLCLWCKGRRNRRHRFESLSPANEDSYVFVAAGARVPGEGSPRHSGEEADPFLQQSQTGGWVSELGGAAAGTSTSRGSYRNSPLANVAATAESSNGNGNGNSRQMSEATGAAPVTRAPVTRIPPPTVGTNSSGESASTASHASGFGVLLDRPSVSGIAYMPITYEHQAEVGRPLSHADMARIDNEDVLPADDLAHNDHYDGAYAYSEGPMAPPRLVIPGSNPNASPEYLPFNISNPASLQDLQEASLQTATRVKAHDLAPRSSPADEVSPRSGRRSSAGAFLGALGLGGVGSWFKGTDGSARNSAVPERTSLLTEKDLEQGQGFLAPNVHHVDSLGQRPAGTGLTADGRRPVSNVSGRSAASGGTMYHDAHSSLPATPVTPFLAPLPRAMAPGDQPVMQMNEHAWMTPSHGPPTYAARAVTPPQQYQSTTATSFDADILDMPAPTALHHFSSGSSLKEMYTGSSAGVPKATPFLPPGLDTVRPVGWSRSPVHQEERTSYPSPPQSEFGGLHGLNLGRGMTMDFDMEDDLGLGHGISIDVLEEAPPGAEQGWRSISSAGTGGAYMDIGRRGNFGMLVQGPGYASEQGSLHSMRSHVTPGSVRSTGSAPASRHDLSINSASSGRPSMGCSSGGFSAGSHNLARTHSLTSDNQRRRGQPMSPALSALGGHQMRASPGGPLSTIIASPTKAYTVRTIASDTATADSTVRPARSLSPLGGPDFPLNAPWAAGLDNDWQASA